VSDHPKGWRLGTIRCRAKHKKRHPDRRPIVVGSDESSAQRGLLAGGGGYYRGSRLGEEQKEKEELWRLMTDQGKKFRSSRGVDQIKRIIRRERKKPAEGERRPKTLAGVFILTG